MMSDYLQLSMIMPYIIHRFLKVSSLKESDVIAIKQRIEASHVNLIPKSIITCWVLVAKTMKAVFNGEFTTEGYEILEECLQNELKLLSKV